MAKKMYLNRALAEAAAKEMERDENVIILGEDLLSRGGGLSTFLGVPEAFPERCFDMPLSEQAFTNVAVGMASMGARPIVDLMFSDFTGVCADALFNHATKMRYNTLGKISIPVVYFAGNGGRGTFGGVGSGVNHSQCVEGWFNNVPGLKIVAPYYANDAYGLLRASIRDDDPVLFLYHEGSLGKKSVVEDDVYIPLNNAANIIKKGTDVTVIAIQSMVPVAEKAAAKLEEEGIAVELIDPRVIIPLDEEAICKSVAKTGKAIIVHEAPVRGGVGGEIAAVIADKCYADLKAPVKRIGALNSPIPCGFAEYYMMPHEENIIEAVKNIVK